MHISQVLSSSSYYWSTVLAKYIHDQIAPRKSIKGNRTCHMTMRTCTCTAPLYKYVFIWCIIYTLFKMTKFISKARILFF